LHKFSYVLKSLLSLTLFCLQDTVILYNIALILQKLASQLLRDEKSTLSEVLQAVHELGLSHKYLNFQIILYFLWVNFTWASPGKLAAGSLHDYMQFYFQSYFLLICTSL